MKVLPSRAKRRNEHSYTGGPVLYWMDREMRAHDNWALEFARKLTNDGEPFGIVYNLISDYLGGGRRQYDFKLGGLKELESLCKEKGIPFFVLLTSDTVKDLAAFVKEHGVGAVVTDMNPLRVNRAWKEKLAKKLDVPLIEVDAHNVVPVWEASDKQEFAARTIRPKIHKRLGVYLDTLPRLMPATEKWNGFPKTDWKKLEAQKVNEAIKPVDWVKPGEKAARKVLESFIRTRLDGYAELRNNPNEDALSNLSPYFHYGMLSPQRAIMEVKKADASQADIDSFVEEALVRRELSDNYCYYNTNYDTFAGFPEWAQKTLNAHREDAREYTYSKRQWEEASTHDELWNACQRQMMQSGKMHGYMRMYWAKKILEWSSSPENAQKIAIYLNDKYELDGRDPNGYVGVAWSIGGVHDRAWTSRPVYGKIRYMNANGCRRKFDVDAYIEAWT